jgi:hypothetical protein
LTDKVTKLDNEGNILFTKCTDPTMDCSIILGAHPIGVTATTDMNGHSFIWVVNYTTALASKFDLNGNLVAAVNVGSTPYTYSDMAGYMLKNVTYRGGSWTVNVNSEVTNTRWQSLMWDETEPSDSKVRVRARSAATEAGLASAIWSNYFDTPQADLSALPTEQWLQIEVELTLSWDDQSPTFDNLKVKMGY